MNMNPLSRIPLFSDLPADELDHLQNMLKTRSLRPGEILFKEGERGEHFYILTHGELEILLGVETKEEMILNILGPGGYLGEMSLIIPGGERTATARASKETALLAMSRDEFNALIEHYPILSKAMVRVLSNRLDSPSGI